MSKKCQKQAEAKRDGVINPLNYNFNHFDTENFDNLKRYESTEVDRRTWVHVPTGTHWSTGSDTHQVLRNVFGMGLGPLIWDYCRCLGLLVWDCCLYTGLFTGAWLWDPRELGHITSNIMVTTRALGCCQLIRFVAWDFIGG